jgi:general secretion pathway protein K
MKELSPYRWRRNSGSALILTFWALCLLSIFALHMGVAARTKLDEVDRLNQYAMLRHIAKAGISFAKAKLQGVFFVPQGESPDVTVEVEAYSDIARIDVKAGDGSAGVSIVDAERRLNINTAPREVMVRLILEVCHVSEGEAAVMMDSIIDWRDKDSEPGPAGAEDDYYASLASPYNCKDAPFNSTDELLLVRGFSGKIYEDLVSFVTVCGNGAVNINTATPEVLLAIGLDNKLVDKVLQFRPGKDGLPGTEDDAYFHVIDNSEGSKGTVFRSDSPVVFTPEDDAAFLEKAAVGLLGTTSANFFVESTATRFHKGWHYTIWALFSKVPKSDVSGAYDIRLGYWRTSL